MPSGSHVPATPSFAVRPAVRAPIASPHCASNRETDSPIARRHPAAANSARLLWPVESAVTGIRETPRRRRCSFSNKPPAPPHPQSPGTLLVPDSVSWGERRRPTEPPGPGSSAAKGPCHRCRFSGSNPPSRPLSEPRSARVIRGTAVPGHPWFVPPDPAVLPLH